MAAVSSVGNAALGLFQQPSPFVQQRVKEENLPAVGNGNSPKHISGADALTVRSQSKLADSLFDLSSAVIAERKLDLFERTGEALGIDQSDFVSMSDYGATIKSAVGYREPIIRGIERELGLDKLGVSLDTVVDAIMGSDDGNAKLEKALRDESGQASAGLTPHFEEEDEIGLYSVSNA